MGGTGPTARRAGRHAIRPPVSHLGRVFSVLVTGVVASIALGACEASPSAPASYPEGTIAAIMAADDRFDTLMKITEQDMPRVALDSISAPELDITFFAPTDDAFAVLPPGALEWLRNDDNVSELQLVYDHHVTRVSHSLRVLRSMIEDGVVEIESLDGGPIRLSLVDDVLHVDEATVVEGDIEAVNGVIHVIDAVMIPDSVTIP
jgi:transforming growth factor-beta-induced protein